MIITLAASKGGQHDWDWSNKYGSIIGVKKYADQVTGILFNYINDNIFKTIINFLNTDYISVPNFSMTPLYGSELGRIYYKEISLDFLNLHDDPNVDVLIDKLIQTLTSTRKSNNKKSELRKITISDIISQGYADSKTEFCNKYLFPKCCTKYCRDIDKNKSKEEIQIEKDKPKSDIQKIQIEKGKLYDNDVLIKSNNGLRLYYSDKNSKHYLVTIRNNASVSVDEWDDILRTLYRHYGSNLMIILNHNN